MAAKRKKQVVRRVSGTTARGTIRPTRPTRKNARPLARFVVRLLLMVFFWGGLGWGLLAGYHHLVTSPYFEITRIDVSGNHYLDRDAVLKQARIGTPANLLAINLAMVRKRLLAHAWVQDAQVSRTIPNILELRIIEQQPIAVVAADRDYLINRQGEAFAYAQPPKAYRLPRIRGLSTRHLGVAGQAPDACLSAVLGLLETTRSSKWLLVYPDILVDPHAGLSLVEKSAAHQVLLGFDHYGKKLTLLGKVRGYLKRQHGEKHITLIDVTQLDRVVVRSQPSLTGTAHLKEV